MKRPIALILMVIISVVSFSLSGCPSGAKDIPTETFVSIWFKIQDDQAFRNRYPDPGKASDEELSAFTQPFGYTAADFRHTKKRVDRDEFHKKEFQELSRKYIDRLAMETLNEMTDRDTVTQTP